MSLSEFLKGIADAIRVKKATTEPINAQNFASEIESIEPLLDTLEITENNEYNVKEYKKVSVIVKESDLAYILIERITQNEFHVPYGVQNINITLPGATTLYLPNTIESFLSGTLKNYYYNVYLDKTIKEYCETITPPTSSADSFTAQVHNNNKVKIYLKDENDEYFLLSGELIIPNNVEYIPTYAFASCLNLTSVIMSDSVKTTGSNVFTSCQKIANLKLSKNLTKVSIGTLSSLTKLVIPASVTEISGRNYLGSSSKKATILMEGKTPPSVGTDSFNTSYLNKIIVPKGTKDIYLGNSYWSTYQNYLYETMVLTCHINSAIVNNESIKFSIDDSDVGVFTESQMTFDNIGFITINNNSTQTLYIGTSSGGSEIGSIASGGSITYTFDGDTTVYITLV